MIPQAARDFAMNEVLPIANKLDPSKATSRCRCATSSPRWATSASSSRGIRRLGSGVRVCADRGARARLAMRVASIIASGQRTRRRIHSGGAAGEYCRDGARRITGGLRGRNRTRVRISPTSRRKATRDGDGWMLNGTRLVSVCDGAEFHLGDGANEDSPFRSAPPP